MYSRLHLCSREDLSKLLRGSYSIFTLILGINFTIKGGAIRVSNYWRQALCLLTILNDNEVRA